MSGRAKRTLTALVAPAVVFLVGCQSLGDGSIQQTSQFGPPSSPKLLATDRSIHGVTQTANAGEIVLQFSPGTSAATAFSVGRSYGLDLIGGPLVSGPFASGRFTFEIPQVDVMATTPTTARVYFPNFMKRSDQRAYLSEHNLRLIRWIRGMDETVAVVRMPDAPLNPTLLDPVAGLFQIALPVGLELASVEDWAKTLAMRVISYDAGNGSTVVHPNAWRPVIPRAISYSSRPQNVAPAAAPLSRLYVQFVSGISPDAVVAQAKKIGLGVVSVEATNLAIFNGDPGSARAAIQLLSDNSSVQCVSASPNPCAATTLPASQPVVAPTPTYSQPSSVSVRVVDGLLQVSWSAATGATSYAIFRTSSATAPSDLVAIVAGQDHTSYVASDQTLPGSSAYYEVVALHPCTPPADSGSCDLVVIPFSGLGTPASPWTNPMAQQTPAVQVAPASPAPSPVAATQPAATPSPPATSSAPAQASPSPSPPAASTAVPATPSPSPPAASTAVPATPSPSPPAASTAVPATPSPSPPAASTAVPATPSPSPPAASTAVPATPSLSPPAASTAVPATPAPSPVVQPPAQTRLGPAPLNAPTGVSVAAADGHVTVSWQSVPGATQYRVYRVSAGGAAEYLATTTEGAFTDTGGTVGSSYSYQVAAVAGSALVGKISDAISATWQAATTAPVVMRSLPAEAGVLSGQIRIQVDARSGDGRGQVTWRLSGPAANLTIGTATGQPSATAPLSWSTELAWDSNTVPDGSYTMTATVSGSSGQQTTVSTVYRIQNVAPPIAPINLAAISQAGGVALTWQQAASMTGTAYSLFRDHKVSGTPLAQFSADLRSFVDTGVQPGTHQYQLVLVDAQGRSSQPARAEVVVAATAAPPDVAPDLQVLLPTGQAMAQGGRVTDRLMLISPAMTGLGFEISSDGRSWTALSESPTCAQDVCTLDLKIDALASGPYSVRAVTAHATSPVHSFVRADATRYAAPTALSAQVTGLGVQLSWTAPVLALPASYQVSRRSIGESWKLLDQVASTNFIDAAAPAGSTIDYRVSAIDPEGDAGSPSDVITVTVPSIELAELQGHGPPSAPTNVEVTAAHGRAVLHWDPVVGSDGYRIERRLEPGGAFAVAGTTSSASFVDSQASATREVSYRVASLIGAVEGSASSVATTLVIPDAAPLPLIESTVTSTRPAAPSTLTATTQPGSVQLSWSAGSANTSATYNVYRLDPVTGAFGLAASSLDSASFTDGALPAPAGFAYVVTATSSGLESLFSDPVWVTVNVASPGLSVELMAPTPSESSFIQAEALQALARVTAAAGLDRVSFAIAPAAGLWKELAPIPVDPHRPMPTPATGAAPAALWATILNLTSMAPGSYKLRVQARDRAGNSQEQVRDLLIAGPAARGPPSFSLSADAIPGGVHLQWSPANSGGFLVQRSLFGPDGPFETVANSQSQHYDDRLVIPGHSYAYQVVQLDAAGATSTIATASPLDGQASSADGGPSISLGPVSHSELSPAVVATVNTPPLTSGLRALGGSYDVSATSLANNQQVHHLGEQAQVSFALPPGLAREVAASAAIYHWNDSSGSWVGETSTVDPTLTSVTATVNHLSQFVLASAPAAGAGVMAQPPPPPTDSAGSASSSPSRHAPSPPAAFQVAADGEVVSLRTANSRVYKKPNGSYQQTISTGLVNYRDATGAWQKIDGNLVQNDAMSSGVHNAANSFRVDLPGTISNRAISLTDGSAVIAMSLVGASAVALVSNGSHATYAAALPGIDASYDVIPNGLKESLVIKSRSTQSTVFAFDISTGGLVLRQQPDGSVLAVDAAGQVKFTINAPWMYDAAIAHSDRGTMSRQVAVTLTGSSGSYRLTYTPDAAWLNDPARRYPVTLDPSFTIYGGGYEYDDQINTYAPDYNYHGYTYLPIGYTYYSSPCCANAPSRAEVQFSNFLYDGFYASSATFYMYQYTNYGTQRGNCCTYYYLTAPTTGWSYTGVTWNNQPGVTGAYSAAYALANGGWVAWDATSVVRAWQTHALANNGLMIYANAENGPWNNNEFFYGGNSGSGPELSVTYDTYSYTSSVSLPTKNIVPNGGSTPVEVVLTNWGTATWGTDTRLSYRWWSGGSVITNYTANIYVPYAIPGCAQPCSSPTSVILRFSLASPSLSTTGPVQLQLALLNNTFWFSSLAWGSPSNSCDQFYYTSTSCSTGTAITLADESGGLAWQGPPQLVSATAGSLISLPLTLTNTSTAGGRNFTWHAYDAADLVRVGIRDYRSTAGAVMPLSNTPNLRTYLAADVAPGAPPVSLNAVIQAPGDPGDYLLRIDLVHDTPTSTTWFADQGNQPLEVRARIVAPSDDKTTEVPVALGDGSSLGVNTSNGFAALSATDISIGERGGASLLLSRTYNGVNGLLSSTGTSATSSTYGLGWTFNFQRSLHLGSLGANTYDPGTGILTDAQGRAWTLTWNFARGLYEDAAANRTVAPSSAQVVTATGSLTVPGLRPVDLLNGTGTVVADAGAPGGYALRFEGTAVPPTALVMPSGVVPVQQNGSIEFWFRPNFDMSVDNACHVFFSDAQMRFGLAWNCPSSPPWGTSVSRAIDFFTYDADTSTYNVLASAAVTWANGSWHHIALTWAEGGAKQLMTDTTVYSAASHSQSPTGDLTFGYEADGTGNSLSFLNGRVAQLRIDGRVVPQAELNTDAASGATVNPTANTLYLGRYDRGSAQSSAGSYVVRNPDQSIETYSSAGVLQSQADRIGNQVDYSYDATGRIQSISDHSIGGRSITFGYNGTSFTATDLGGRTVTYQLNAAGDLVSVTRSNQVPDPRTGVFTAQNATTSYAYASGHLMQQVTDPRGAKTTVNYDQSYRQVVMIDNPSAYWRLGEVSGTTAADSTGSYPATLHGGIALGQSGAIWGESSLAYQFDGSTGYLSTSSTIPGFSSNVTLEAWVNHAGLAWSATHEMLVSLRGGAGVYLSVYSGYIFMSVYDGTNQRLLQGGSVPTTGWHHLVGTWDGSQMRLYIDGVVSATSPTYVEGSLWASGATIVGSFDAASYFFKGRLDEAVVYPAALAATRIQAHFVAGRLGIAASPSGYAANVAYDSPVGYWRLGESSGTQALDQSGMGNVGKATGGVTLGQSGALANDADMSTSFDGSTGYITTGAVGSLSRWTLEAWIKPSAGQSTDAAVMSDVYSTLINYVIFFNPTGATPLGLVAGFYDGAGWHYTSPVNVALGSWSHVAATYDGTLISVYIDGTQVASLSYAASPTSNGLGLRIGRRWDIANNFAGSIDEAAVYPTALSAARLLAHYNAGRAPTIAGASYPKAVTADTPAGYWRLGETSGSSALDSSGSGRSGTDVGGVTLSQAGGIANDPDYATRFNGSNAYVSLGNPAAFQVNTGTIEAWVNTTTTAQSAIVSKLYAWWFGVQTTGRLGLYDMTAGVMRDTGVVVNDGAWHQVVAVFQSGVAGGSQMYVDGKVAGSPFLMTVANQTVEVEIAGYSTTSQFLNGSVDEVALYPTALSAARILNHYQSSRLAPIPTTGSAVGTYAARVTVDGPAGFWRLDELTGSVAHDRSSFNNAGAYSATGVSLGQTGALATDSDATASFDGATGYVSVPSSPSLNIAGPMTIEAWIKKTVTSTGPIVEFNNGSAAGVQMWNYNTSDALYVNFTDTAGATHNIQSPGGLFALNNWYHVAAVYDGAYGTLYVDGVIVARSYLGSFTPQTSYPLYIARRPSGSPNYYLSSGIADVAIYPYALTASRVLAHYNASWDFTQSRVASVQDARGTTVASLNYNDDLATTQVINARGLPAYFTFQQYGGRTLSVTDSGNDVTRYEYDGGAAYRLMATVSPTGIRQSRFINSGAPVGQQSQVLMSDVSGQPSSVTQVLMSGAYPDPSLYGSTSTASVSESWIWDPTLTVQPGVASNRSTPGVAGAHHHDLTFSNGLLIPAGSQLTQWVYLEPGVQLPGNLMLQLTATDGSAHRAFWGTFNLQGSLGTSCPTNCFEAPLPVAGRWVALTVALGPAKGTSPPADLDMAGRTMNGIQFVAVGGTGAAWWGPTTLQFPAPSVSDPTRAVSRFAYNSTNDVVASVDPNGIAAISDVDASGLVRASSSGVETAPVNLLQDNVITLSTSAWQQEFAYPGTASAVSTTQHNGIGSLSQTHSSAGLQSDLYMDVTGLSRGTYILVSVWVMTQAGATGAGGASLMVENHLAAPNTVQRRSASIQTAGQWAQLTLPFIVDNSGQVRIHLWQENLLGTTTWADLHVDDVTAAPDVTLQHPVGVFAGDFEVQPDATWTLGTATAVKDATQAHSGLYSIKDTHTSSSLYTYLLRSLTITTSATYRVTAWVRTVASGGNGGNRGAQLCAQFSGSTCTPFVTTEGQWQQLAVTVAGSGTLTVQPVHQNFQGDVFWDDVSVERVADQTPATSGTWRGTGWTGTVVATNGAAATWASSWTGGLGGGPSRQVTITSPGLTNDISDTLATSALRTSASYMVSVWAGSTVANTTITFSGQAFDFGPTCVLQTSPTLCQNSFIYNGGDKTSTNVIINYGGQGARTVAISHPLVALASQLSDYTVYGQPSRSHDIFGHSTSTTFDSNSLYPTQTVVTATPSPSITTNYTYNSLGQLILSTRINGAQSIAAQSWLDSWGRQVGVVNNCVPAAAPPSLCSAAQGPATNVMTRYAYDLNGNLTDKFDQAQVSGGWIDNHNLFDANNNRMARIQNCVTVTNPCDGSSSSSQNVVTVFAYDVVNNPIDMYAPVPGCTGSCVPAPTCSVSPPLTCIPPAAQCPVTTCTDAHAVYDLTGRVYQQIANYNGPQDVSQANLTTQYAYDADGRVVDTLTPITSATLQTGQIDEHKIYDVLGRMVTEIKGYAIPSWMGATTQARTDNTFDAGGRVVSVTGPGTGSALAANRVATITDYDDLGRPLRVTADPGTLNAITRTVYDPRGATHVWTPATQQLTAGLETTTNHDLAGHVTSAVKDDGTGGLHLTTSTTYDGFGRATDVADPRGIDTNTTYDAGDRTSSVTRSFCPSGNTNPNCFGSGILADQNLSTSYVYDLAGNRIQVVNPRGIIEYTAFDALGRPALVTENCQAVPTPPSTSCGVQSSDQNVTSSQTYDQSGYVVTATDPLSRVNVYTYDALGRKVSATGNCIGTGGLCNGAVTSGQNLVTQWQVSAHGAVLQERSPRQCTTAAPCYQGTTGTSLTDGANLVTGYTYDGLLRLLSVTEDQSTAAGHLNLVTSYTYDPSSHKLSQVDGRMFTTSYTVDNLGRVAKVTDAGGNVVQTNYSLADEVVSTINARGKTNANTLDRVGRVVGVSYWKADGTTAAVQSFGYDADGNKTCFSDAALCGGNPTTIVYDHLNRVSTATAPSPFGTTGYTYFLDGTESTVTDPTGTTTFTEDHLGRVATMADPLNGSGSNPTVYTFDAGGRLTTRAEAYPRTPISKVSATAPTITRVSGASTSATWNADEPRTVGHLLIASASSYGGSNLTISSGWTQVAQLVQGSGFLRLGLWYRVATGADAAPTFSSTGASKIEGSVSEWKGNDPTAPLQANTVATRSAASGKSITLTMAAAPASGSGLSFAVYAEHLSSSTTVTEAPSAGWSREAVRTVSDNQHLGRDYRLNPSTGAPDSDTPTYTTSGTVNAIAGIVAFFAAAPGAGNGVVTNAGYTGVDQLASKTEVSTGTTLASWTNIGYDLAQNRTAETLSYYAGNPYPDPQVGTATYQYDSVNQLSQSSIPSKPTSAYGFDAAHNLTSNAGTTQAYNPNESLQTVGAATVGSDADGNQQKDVAGNILNWNSFSQLESFSTTETYAYDAAGRLIKVTNGTNVTQFVYRGLSGQVVEELNGSGGVIRSYAWDTMGRQLYVKIGTNVYYEITNPHGDVAALASTSAVVGTEHFDAWGNPLTAGGTTIPFGFQGAAGSWTDATTGFISMGVRWYYPRDGRFLSNDPAAGTASPRTPLKGLRWLYALNSPVRYSDPTGLNCEDRGNCYTPPPPPPDLCDRASCPGDTHSTDTTNYNPPPVAAQNPPPQRVCGRGGCYTVQPSNWDPWAALQNGMVALGQALPQPLRQAYVREVRVIENVDAGATDRITHDISSAIDTAGATATDNAAIVHGVLTGDWKEVADASNRNSQRTKQEAVSVLQGAAQLNPQTMAMSAANYGANVAITWQTKGSDAAIDQMAYDYGYNVIGGGTEAAFVTGVTMGVADFLAPEAVAAQAADAGAAALTKGEQAALNQGLGNAWRDEVAVGIDQLPNRMATTEVYKWTPFGKRFIDVEVSDGSGNVLGGIETKFGNSLYTPLQQLKDAWLYLRQGYRVNPLRYPGA